MLKIKVDNNLETALRIYKSKVNNTKQIQKLKEREVYVKPSVKRRDSLLKAKYKQSMRKED